MFQSPGWMLCRNNFTRHAGMYIFSNRIYHAFFSFAIDDLLENPPIPTWIGGNQRSVYWKDLNQTRLRKVRFSLASATVFSSHKLGKQLHV